MSYLQAVRGTTRLLAPAALLFAAGCFGGGYGRDTVATRRSTAILDPYADVPRDSGRMSGLPASLNRTYGLKKGRKSGGAGGAVLPAYANPRVKLPGSAERAWVGPPRTRPYYPLDLRPPAPPVAAPIPGPGPDPGTRRPGTTRRVDKDLLQPGDTIRVTVSGHPEFGGEWIVDERGLLEIPDVGAFGVKDSITGEQFSGKIGRVSGKKTSALEKDISDKLRIYFRKAPQVTVEITGRQGG